MDSNEESEEEKESQKKVKKKWVKDLIQTEYGCRNWTNRIFS